MSENLNTLFLRKKKKIDKIKQQFYEEASTIHTLVNLKYLERVYLGDKTHNGVIQFIFEDIKTCPLSIRKELTKYLAEAQSEIIFYLLSYKSPRNILL